MSQQATCCLCRIWNDATVQWRSWWPLGVGMRALNAFREWPPQLSNVNSLYRRSLQCWRRTISTVWMWIGNIRDNAGVHQMTRWTYVQFAEPTNRLDILPCDLQWLIFSANSQTNFALLIKDLSVAFKQHGYKLSAAVGAPESYITKSYDVEALDK